MPYFKYEARDKSGKPVNGTASALNKQELIAKLQKDGLTILAVKETAQTLAASHAGSRKLHRKANINDMRLFAQQFSILLENGVVITDAIEVISHQAESSALLESLQRMRKDLEGGMTLRGAMERHPAIFSSLWLDMVEAGEISGQLPFVTREIESFLESSDRLKKKVINALIYPSILLMVSIGAIIVFTVVVIPKFIELFASLKAKLPPLTQAVVDISNGVRQYFPLIIIAVAALVFALKKALSTQQGRRSFENVLIKLPVAGTLFTALAIDRFSSTLGVLLKSGIPIIRAMEIAARTSQSLVFYDRLEEAKAKISAGVLFSESLRQTGLFPPMCIQLMLVAEKTGNFSGMLEQVAKHYDDLIDVAVTRFTALLEPLILVFMGTLIGTLLVAMFMPIIKIASGGQ